MKNNVWFQFYTEMIAPFTSQMKVESLVQWFSVSPIIKAANGWLVNNPYS